MKDYKIGCVDAYAIQITKDDFSDGQNSMIKRTDAWAKTHGTSPAIIYTSPGSVDYVTFKKYLDMKARYIAWYNKNKVWPNFVWVTQDGKSPTTTKSAFHLTVEGAYGKNYNSFTEYYALQHGTGQKWQGYEDDKKTLAQELAADKNKVPQNCSDSCQEAYKVAQDMGYDVVFEHVMCRKSGGHIRLRISGKEFGNLGTNYKNWVKVDIAAARQSNYPIRKVWCDDGTFVSWNDPWLLSDDGKT